MRSSCIHDPNSKPLVVGRIVALKVESSNATKGSASISKSFAGNEVGLRYTLRFHIAMPLTWQRSLAHVSAAKQFSSDSTAVPHKYMAQRVMPFTP